MVQWKDACFTYKKSQVRVLPDVPGCRQRIVCAVRSGTGAWDVAGSNPAQLHAVEAQQVVRHFRKVEVAGSSPVIGSRGREGSTDWNTQQGNQAGRGFDSHLFHHGRLAQSGLAALR